MHFRRKAQSHSRRLRVSAPHQGGRGRDRLRSRRRPARRIQDALDPGETEAGRGPDCSRASQSQAEPGLALTSEPVASQCSLDLPRSRRRQPCTLPPVPPRPPRLGVTCPRLTCVARISSRCPLCRTWVRWARARGCRSLNQVTAGSGSESVSQLRTALSPACTRTVSWGLLGARLKVGGTEDRRPPSEAHSVVLPRPSLALPWGAAYGGPGRSHSRLHPGGWRRPGALEEGSPGQHPLALSGPQPPGWGGRRWG